MEFSKTPMPYDAIAASLSGYESVKDKIAALNKKGDIIRLKKGLYSVSPKLANQKVSLEAIANNLYGPSYVSLESALAYYGLIPEKVYTVRSACFKRGKSFATPFGKFEYFKTPERYFQTGINQVFADSVSFLIASPEKAVCDMFYVSSNLRLQSAKAVAQYLTGFLRIDGEQIKKFNEHIIEDILSAGVKKTEIANFLKAVKNAE
ncbi:MAG: hypothetical protein FWC57_04550 [Endomicrobia bacterium]|nr:hypothetical protein [Endomicrobiia bacterium]